MEGTKTPMSTQHSNDIEPQTLSLQALTLTDEDRTEYSTTSTVSRILEDDLGLKLKTEWLDACLRAPETAVTEFITFDDAKKAKVCFEKFLNADMNCCGAGVLPSNVDQLDSVDLQRPFVLQVDEIENVSQPRQDRYKEASPGFDRCLKLSMTDSVQRVFGMEYQPINDLKVFSPAGLKVAVSNVNVSNGLMILVPEGFQVLGGSVEELEAARQRFVAEVNKPPWWDVFNQL